jgi:hypothetical protein
MNNFKTSPKEQRITDARQVEATGTLKRAFVRFPSYLHVFDFFFQQFHGGSRWGMAPSHLGLSEQLPTAPASVAFV